jgi:hypothetical protein
MSDDRKRPEEWGALFEHWRDAQPADGFADRVLAACDDAAQSPERVAEPARGAAAPPLPLHVLSSSRLVREAAPPRSIRGGVLLAAAVAAALLLIPIALRRRDPAPPPPIAVAAGTPSFDLGPGRD